MTLAQLLTTLRRRVAASHTTGGLTVVARQLGISKELLHQYLHGKCVPTPEHQAELVAALKAAKKKG